jgi:hypothetical protein
MGARHRALFLGLCNFLYCRYFNHASLLCLMTLSRRPEAAVKLFVCGRSVDRARAALAGRKDGSKARPKAVGSAAAAAAASSGDISDSFSTVVNPAMLQAAQRSSDGLGSGSDSAGIVEHVASMTDAPSEVQWAAIRGSIVALAASAKSLAAENAALKQAATRAEAEQENMILSVSRGSSGAAASGGISSRRAPSARITFGQTVASGGTSAAAVSKAGAPSPALRAGMPRSSSLQSAGGSNQDLAALGAASAGMGVYASTRNPLAGGAPGSRSSRRLIGGSLGTEFEDRSGSAGAAVGAAATRSPLMRAVARGKSARGVSADGLELAPSADADSPRLSGPSTPDLAVRKSSRGISGDDDSALLPPHA